MTTAESRLKTTSWEDCAIMSQGDLSGMVTMIVAFLAFLLGVQATVLVTARLRSITFIKSVHTIAFVPLSVLLFVLVYEAATGRISYVTWVAIGVFLAQGVLLLTNNGRCPLTKYAEEIGSTHGQVTDFFFPKWFADHVFQVYGALFFVSLAILVVRAVS
jgi:hypothetical protein